MLPALFPSISPMIGLLPKTRTSPYSFRPYLPARPPIWLISAVLIVRKVLPSNFSVSAKITRLIGREIPRPMASVATTMFVSPEVYLRTSLRLASGGKAP